MKALISEMQLRMLVRERHFETSWCEGKLSHLRKLHGRIRDGTLPRLPETRIEQSFNERLFAEVFDYQTLLMRGTGTYHLQPKNPTPNGGYDDLGLGFFTDRTTRRLVHVELKGFRTPLQKKQKDGHHRGRTPVEQAFATVGNDADIRWIIVSNCDEVLLFQANNSTACARITLSEVTAPDQLRCAYCLLGRPLLLGDEGNSPLWRLIEKGHPMELGPVKNKIRLVHEARVASADEIPMFKLDDSLREALRASVDGKWWWPAVGEADSPVLEGDRLVISATRASGARTRIELTRSGTLRVQEDLNGGRPAVGLPNLVDLPVEDLIRNLANFVRLARLSLRRFAGSSTPMWMLAWTLQDADKINLVAAPGWTPTNRQVYLRYNGDEAASLEQGYDLSNLAPAYIAPLLEVSVRDLLFPFKFQDEHGIVRICPKNGALEAKLRELGFAASKE